MCVSELTWHLSGCEASACCRVRVCAGGMEQSFQSASMATSGGGREGKSLCACVCGGEVEAGMWSKCKERGGG